MVDPVVDEPGVATVAKAEDDKWITSSCGGCYSSCGIRVHRVNGVAVKIEGVQDFPHNWGRLCAKGNAAIMGLYDPNRVSAPLTRTNPEKGIGVDPKWTEISWEQALETITEKLKKTRQDNPDKLFICTFDTTASSVAAAWGAAFGSRNLQWMAADYFCGAGLHLATYLTNASFHMDVDLKHCNYLILFGSQMGFGVGSSPNLTTQEMSDARVRGLHLAVVDPVCTTAGSKADEWIPIRPGTDGALALAMLNVILNDVGTYDTEFIRAHTNGSYLVGADGFYVRDKETGKPLAWDISAEMARPFDSSDAAEMAIEGVYTVGGVECRPSFLALKDHVRQYSPEEASRITTVPAETIRRLSREYVNAACVGATIVVEGQQVPYRPAAVHMYRGAYSHKHSTHHILAIQLLNIVVGNIYTAGGHFGINPVGPWWEPKEGADGLMVAADEVQRGVPPYDFLDRKPVPPRTAGLETLFPVTWQRDTARHLSARYPEKFGLSTPPIEVLIHCRGNIMMTTVDPKDVAAVLNEVPFMVSFANFLDETAEFADIVLPDAHFLERLDPRTNSTAHHISPASGYWYWNLRQPVVTPPFKSPYWIEVLFELADRAGFREDFNTVLAKSLKARTEVKLELSRAYGLEELADIWLKAESGDDARGLDWFREHGHLKFKRTTEESYPILALKYRIPLYYEHFLTAKANVEKVSEALHLPWDTADFSPLPQWLPCPAFEDKSEGFDLITVNYTLPWHQYSVTVENPWLNEITERHPYGYKIMVNTQTALNRGIRDGATIWVETVDGQKVKGEAKVTECVHPEVVAIGGVFGAWARRKPIARGKGAHFNSLLSFGTDRIDPISGSADACARVKIYPA